MAYNYNMYNIITSDETWLYFYDPMDRQSSKEWRKKEVKTPHIVQREILTRKIMASLFIPKASVLSWIFLREISTADASWYSKKILSNSIGK